jgi:hypothetical protein
MLKCALLKTENSRVKIATNILVYMHGNIDVKPVCIIQLMAQKIITDHKHYMYFVYTGSSTHTFCSLMEKVAGS